MLPAIYQIDLNIVKGEDMFNPLKVIGEAVARARKARRTNKLNEIAARGVSPVIMSDQNGNHAEEIGMFSWQSVYDSFIKSGLSPEEATNETDARVWTID